MSTSSRAACWAAFLAALTLGPAFDPVMAEVRRVSSEPCKGAKCYSLEVVCENLPAREVNVRHYARKKSRGTVIFTVGGFGRGRYNKLPMRKLTQQKVLAAGFEVFQVEWTGPEGWGTDAWGAGFRRVGCGYPEVVRWIAAKAVNGEVVCAQGNSGGSLQNSYGLALYGLEDVLDMVIMSGGPPLSRLDQYCFPERARDLGREPGAEAGAPRMAATTGRTLVDVVMGWEGTADYCKRVDRPSSEIVESLQRDSLVPPFAEEKRDFNYPTTKVNFVESLEDPAARQGRLYFDAVSSAKQWHDVPGRAHQVDNTEAGSALIQRLFESECRAQ